MLLQNKVAVITGGTGVLGSALTKAIAAEGAKVAILGRSLEKGEKLAAEIKATGGTALALSVDVCDKATIEAAHKTINEKLGLVDILLNGAGGNHPDGVTKDEFYDNTTPKDDDFQDFFKLGLGGVEHVYNLNYMGTFIPTQVFAKDMVGRKECSVLNISSVSAGLPLTKVPAYSAAKAAISNFTHWLAVYFAKEGIRVNALVPGFFLTEQNRTLLTNEDGSLTARGEKILSQTPMGHFGEPEDLVSTVLWLCNPASKFVTGITVPVDGGFTAYNGV